MTTPPLPRCHNPHPKTTWRHRLLHNIGGGRWVCEDCWTVAETLETERDRLGALEPPC